MINTPEHSAQTKQREQMHKRVARDAKLWDEEHAMLRRKAEATDAHRNQPITRGEILDAIDATARTMGGNVGDAYDVATTLLGELRKAFE